MIEYYKGDLVLTENFEFVYINLDDDGFEVAEAQKLIKRYRYNEELTDSSILTEIQKILNYRDKRDIPYIYLGNRTQIIFEIKFDKDGNKYAKEILTGFYFPLSYETKIDFFKDGDGDIIGKIRINQNKIKKVECVVADDYGVASNNEVNYYRNKNMDRNIFTSSLVKKRFYKKIETLFNQNLYASTPIFINKEETAMNLEKQDKITKSMENIEYLLGQLKSKDSLLYSEYNDEYNKLMGEDSLVVTEISFEELSNLEAKIELNLKTSKRNANNVIEYLNSLISEYLTHFLNNNDEKVDNTLEDLNRLNNLFLKVKDEYSYQEQRNVIRKISLAYVLSVKENIDNVSVEDLEKGYFKDNIKSIFLAINLLIETNIIKMNASINLINDLSVSDILDIIKNMKFNTLDIENTKKLIKTLEN